jgi:HEAT repeat protein
VTPSATPRGLMEQARLTIRRAVVRRSLEDAAAGKSQTATIDLDEKGLDVAALVHEVTTRLPPDGHALQRLVNALHRSGTTDAIIDGLAARDGVRRARCARLVGSLGMAQAVGWLGPMLASRERPVRDAAARALGKIGGIRSAEALMMAIRRIGPSRMLIVELTRAAPDLFLEVELSGPYRPAVRSAVAVAAGLRGRHTAIGPLLAMLTSGTRRERIVSSRALGWIGARHAAPVIANALRDREWKVRMSAAKALSALETRTEKPALEALLADRNPRVRAAGRHALRRLEGR